MPCDVLHLHISEAPCEGHTVSAWVHWYRNAPVTHNHHPLQEQTTADNPLQWRQSLKTQQRAVGTVSHCQYAPPPNYWLRGVKKNPQAFHRYFRIWRKKIQKIRVHRNRALNQPSFHTNYSDSKIHLPPTYTSETLTPKNVTHSPKKMSNSFTMQKYKLLAHHSFPNTTQSFFNNHSNTVEVP